ncbi:hypothetical protein M3Y99_01589800 [Aphelenchoides fujianensis]|nr:hypothetical protein M3Y99_01589800 [Aphelenchoides fujianensis]
MSGQREQILCYQHTFKSGGKECAGFVYWKEDDRILGFADFSTPAVYEKEMERRERQTLLKNIADSLLENKWRSTFKAEGLRVGKVTDDGAELCYLSHKTTLPRVDDAVMVDRQVELVRALVAEVQSLRETNEPKTIVPVKRHIRVPAGPYQSAFDRNRRVRGLRQQQPKTEAAAAEGDED